MAIDLEMAQPSNNIIEIGAAIGDTDNYQIIDKISIFVNPHEQLSEEIIKLTSISQEDVDLAKNLDDAYKDLLDFSNKYAVHKQLVTWGSGDIWALKSQLQKIDLNIKWEYGYTYMNVKNIVQAMLTAKNRKTQGGLAKSLGKFGLGFKGKKHRADDDSVNTLRMYFKILELLKCLNF